MAALLDRRPDLDAVFVASDLMASGALQVLRERGRRVPDDVAVVGFDDLAPIAEHTDPPLTTVHQDIEGMGRLMARLLFSPGDDGPTDGGATAPGPQSSVVTPTRLVVRQSARRVTEQPLRCVVSLPGPKSSGMWDHIPGPGPGIDTMSAWFLTT